MDEMSLIEDLLREQGLFDWPIGGARSDPHYDDKYPTRENYGGEPIDEVNPFATLISEMRRSSRIPVGALRTLLSGYGVDWGTSPSFDSSTGDRTDPSSMVIDTDKLNPEEGYAPPRWLDDNSPGWLRDLTRQIKGMQL